MAANSKIEWTHHTFNPWIGCTKVSDGCKFCYAEALMDKRWGKVEWGPNGTRNRTSDSNWREPFKWDRAAAKAGERHRVFCASLADVFEDRPELVPWRRELFDTICRTPNLDWLLLTKRPENALGMMVEAGLYAVANPNLPCPQPNLWLGTSVENQKAADERIPHLLRCPAAVRFLSCEPLLGAINFDRTGADWMNISEGIDWVIVGGESGPGARPMHPAWARSLRDQCQAAGVPYFFKQWGNWVDLQQSPECEAARDNGHNPGFCAIDLSGKPTETPAADRSRGDVTVYQFGKKAAGRLLDGREWSEFPASPALV